MDAKTCLEKLRYVGVLSVATTDAKGYPQVRSISAIHYEPESLYFFTARGKDFCKELLASGRLQMLGYTKFKEMIRLSGKAELVPEAEQTKWKNLILKEQPYLSRVYPGSTKEIGIIFRVKEGELEYFNLGEHPIFRENYTFGTGQVTQKGYEIAPECTGCGICAESCPQHCIVQGRPYRIEQTHCLRCGNCLQHCPAGAVRHRGTAWNDCK